MENVTKTILPEVIHVNQFSFTYPNGNYHILDQINFSLKHGEFVVLCGKSGCGKTTLLRCMKPQIAPVGKREGFITELKASDVGFVFQNPDNQIVTDTVRHELAFGLENMGMPTKQIRARVAETALFFGIDEWIDKSVHEISGGEKQLLNLAAVIAMQPKLLILDEPTSQLDPVAQKNFLDMLVRVNRELGISVFLSEHRLEHMLPIADRVLFLKEGSIAFNGVADDFINFIFEEEMEFINALPIASKIAKQIADEAQQQINIFPMTVREGQEYLRKYNRNKMPETIPELEEIVCEKPHVCIDVQNIWFQYARQTPYVLKGLSLTVTWGQMHMILGGNGSGKSTLLSILSKRFYANRGKIKVDKEKHGLKIELLTQNPKAMFSRDTVREELNAVGILEEAGNKEKSLIYKLQLQNLLEQHPYDLSGGEQQRLGLALVFSKEPDLILLDEPTKGLDPFMKEELAEYLKVYTEKGGAILCVTHDVEFAAEYGDVCSLLFEGEILTTQESREFFRTNLFYTTAEERIKRNSR